MTTSRTILYSVSGALAIIGAALGWRLYLERYDLAQLAPDRPNGHRKPPGPTAKGRRKKS
jgi:hypothetical protein